MTKINRTTQKSTITSSSPRAPTNKGLDKERERQRRKRKKREKKKKKSHTPPLSLLRPVNLEISTWVKKRAETHPNHNISREARGLLTYCVVIYLTSILHHNASLHESFSSLLFDVALMIPYTTSLASVLLPPAIVRVCTCWTRLCSRREMTKSSTVIIYILQRLADETSPPSVKIEMILP